MGCIVMYEGYDRYITEGRGGGGDCITEGRGGGTVFRRCKRMTCTILVFKLVPGEGEKR